MTRGELLLLPHGASSRQRELCRYFDSGFLVSQASQCCSMCTHILLQPYTCVECVCVCACVPLRKAYLTCQLIGMRSLSLPKTCAQPQCVSQSGCCRAYFSIPAILSRAILSHRASDRRMTDLTSVRTFRGWTLAARWTREGHASPLRSKALY